MSPYLLIFLLLVGFAVWEYLRQSAQKVLYWAAFGILAAMLCLRYGQGSDYFTYWEYYLATPPLPQAQNLFDGTIHGEGGWLLLCSLCRWMGVPFAVLVGVLSAFQMVCLDRFIRKFSPLWTVTLLLAYPTLYLTYAMSALRQGLVLLFFLGFLVDWLCRKKWKAYILGMAVCLLFHASAAVFLLPLLLRRFSLSGKRTLLGMAICGAASYLITGTLVWFVPAFAAYAGSGPYLPAIGERLISTLVIIWAFFPQKEAEEKQQVLLQLYLLGSLVYCALLWNGLVASRMAVYFKTVEIALFAIACRSGTGKSKAVAGYLLALTTVLYCKNILSYIHQGSYIDGTTIWNYPYLHLFDWEQAALWRLIPENFR